MKEVITAKELCFWVQGYINGCSIARDNTKDPKYYCLSKEEFYYLVKRLERVMDNT